MPVVVKLPLPVLMVPFRPLKLASISPVVLMTMPLTVLMTRAPYQTGIEHCSDWSGLPERTPDTSHGDKDRSYPA